jgi:RHS repeat-associated protein
MKISNRSWCSATAIALGVAVFGGVAQAEEVGPVSPEGRGFASGPDTAGNVDSSTGTGTFDYGILTPEARGGVALPLGLHYRHTAGQGEAGQGFGLNIPNIKLVRGSWAAGVGSYTNYPFPRETVPSNRYTFGDQALVRIGLIDHETCAAAPGEVFPGISQAAVYYRLQREGAFIRFLYLPGASGGTWVLQYKSGLVEEYGIALGTAIASASVMFDTEEGQAPVPVRWYLRRRYDQHVDAGGNRVNLALYRWSVLGARGLPYLTDVYDTPISNALTDFSRYAHHTRLVYENPDYRAWSAVAPWKAEPEMRLSHVDVASHEFYPASTRQQVRRYWFTYWPQPFFQTKNEVYSATVHAPVRGKSFLKTIQMEGACGVAETPGGEATDALPDASSCARLPATTFTFADRGTAMDVGLTLETGSPKTGAILGTDPYFHEPAISKCTTQACFITNTSRTAFVDVDRDGYPDLVSRGEFNFQSDLRFFHNEKPEPGSSIRKLNMACVANRTTTPSWMLAPQTGFTSLGYWGTADDVGFAQGEPLLSTLNIQRFVKSAGPSTCAGWDLAATRPMMEWQAPSAPWTIAVPPLAPLPAIQALSSFAGDLDNDGVGDRVVSNLTQYAVVQFSQRSPRAFGSLGGIVPFVEQVGSNLLIQEGEKNVDGMSVDPFDRSAMLILADLTGDGVADAITQVRDTSPGFAKYDLVTADGRGTGKFRCFDGTNCTRFARHVRNADGSPGASRPILAAQPFGAPGFATSFDLPAFHDINGDGLADAIAISLSADGFFLNAKVWLNEDGQNFRRLCEVKGIACTNRDVFWAHTNSAGVAQTIGARGLRFADLDANGTDDIIAVGNGELYYAGFSNPSTLSGGGSGSPPPGLLRRVDNGYGGITEYNYNSVQSLQLPDWQTTSPQVAFVVTNVATYAPGPHSVIKSDYTYSDPSYDPWKRSLLGFGHVKAAGPGGTIDTDYLFGHCQAAAGCAETSDDDYEIAETGVPYRQVKSDGAGKPLSETIWRRERRTLFVPVNERLVYYAPVIDEVITIFGAVTAPGAPTTVTVVDSPQSSHTLTITSPGNNGERIWHTFTIDTFGNTIANWDYGRAPFTGGGDEVITRNSDFATFSNGWTFRNTQTTLSGNLGFSPQRLTKTSFDAFGDAIDESGYLVGSGFVYRHHVNSLAIAPVPTAASTSGWVRLRTYDRRTTTGMPERMLGPDIPQPGGGSDRACIDYVLDAYQGFAAVTTAYTGYGCGGSANLRTEATMHRGFGTVDSRTEASGSRSKVTLDAFGRVKAAFNGDTSVVGNTNALAATRYTYEVTAGGPVQRVLREDLLAGGSAYHQHFDVYDGLARLIVRVDQADTTAGDTAPWIASGRRTLSDLNLPFSEFLPEFYAGDPRTINTIGGTAYATNSFDSYGRALEHREAGVLTSRKTYDGLREFSYDANSLTAGGPHQDNYTTTAFDGHGRLLYTSKRLKTSGVFDNIDTVYDYTPFGEVRQKIERHNGADQSSKQMTRDSFGRMVGTNDDTQPIGTSYGYIYDNAGRLVGTSDERGCGSNFHYDAIGRLRARDDSPCEAHHAAYSPIDLTTGVGAEAFTVFDVPEAGEPAAQYNNRPADLAGQLVASYTEGAHDRFGYDNFGNMVLQSRRLAKVAPSTDPSTRYTGFWFQRRSVFDQTGRLLAQGTGADVAQLQDGVGAADVTYTYSNRDTTKTIGGSFGSLIASASLDAQGLPVKTVYGDAAATAAAYTYDARRRLDTFKLSRTGPAFWTATAVAPYTKPPVNATTQTVLSLLKATYDPASNPLTVEDQATTTEWPAGARPMRKAFTYDSLYRVTNVDYSYRVGAAWTDDTQTSPFAFETGIGDGRPLPQRIFANRVRNQANAYSWFGTTTSTTDTSTVADSNAVYDRSLGPITNERARFASAGAGASPSVVAKYDATGNLVDLIVKRAGTCVGGLCIQRYSYQWDEQSQLKRARRWDYSTLPATEPVYPSLPTRTADRELKYLYGYGGRVLKQSVNNAGASTFSAEVFASLRLNRTTFEAGEYVRSKLTSGVTTVFETLYIGSFARVVYADSGIPIRTAAGKQHVFFQASDVLGSTSVVFDKATSETVEKITYDAWGRTESDYRPARWSSFREDYRFTEKEEDIEVGLTYFGARYYSPYLGRWASPDPLQIHAGGGDANPYAYVRGKLAQSTDPTGLDDVMMPPEYYTHERDHSGDQKASEPSGPSATPENSNGNHSPVHSEGYIDPYFDPTDTFDSDLRKDNAALSALTPYQTPASRWNQRPNTGSPFGPSPSKAVAAGATLGLTVESGSFTGGLLGGAAEFFGLGGAAAGATAVVIAFAPAVAIGIGVGALAVIGLETYNYLYPTIEYGIPATLVPGYLAASEHTKGARPSTKGKHEKGQTRKQTDRGGEKGDDARDYTGRRRPEGWKGPYPPK